MAKFLTGKNLEDVIYDIIYKAENVLLIVSPYIRLDGYFKNLFDNHQHNPKIHIIIIFGKNEGRVEKSLSADDFEYFRKFHYITIVYVPSLHGKYYGNDREGVVTSINMHDYSFTHNIEFGVHHQTSIFDSIKESTDQAAWNYCREMTDNNDVILAKRPVYEKKLLGLSKNFLKSETLFDATRNLLSNLSYEKKRINDFPEFIEFGKSQQSERLSREEFNQSAQPVQKPQQPEKTQPKNNPSSTETGYCIRTGKPIPFNTLRPFSYDAYKSWAAYGNPDFPEKYCHRTGKPSFGKTSMSKPVLD